MRHCTLYMTLPSSAMLADLIRQQLPDFAVSGSVTEGAFVATRKKLFSRQRITFSFRSTDYASDDFARQRGGMANFFAAIPTEVEQVQKMLVAQIERLTIEVSVKADKTMDDSTANAVTGIATAAHGLVLLPPGNLYTGEGALVFDTEGNSEFETYKVSALAEVLDQHTVATDSGNRRKQLSIARLKARKVPYIEHLPAREGDEHAELRTQQEVVERVLALVTVAAYAEILSDEGMGAARAFIDEVFGPFRGTEFCSPQERDFLGDEEPDASTTSNMAWRYECAWVGLWALGIIDTLPYPNSPCDVGFMARTVRQSDTFEEFASRAVLRPAAEILDEADLIYRYHWACVDARIKGQPDPADLSSDVVMERHHILNWLIRYCDQDWDDVSTDT